MRISDWSSDVCSSDLFSCSPLPANVWSMRKRSSRRMTGERENSVDEKTRSSSEANLNELFAASSPIRQHSHIAAISSGRSEEHTSELQSLKRISYAVFCLTKKNKQQTTHSAKQD